MNSKAGSIEILGTPYEVFFQTEDENDKLTDSEGLCEIYSHKIIVDPTGIDDPLAFENAGEHVRQVLRHEAIHAFFAEAGRSDYTRDEALVEFLAMLWPKLQAVMADLDRIVIPEAGYV